MRFDFNDLLYALPRALLRLEIAGYYQVTGIYWRKFLDKYAPPR